MRVSKDQKDMVTQIFHIIIGARRALSTNEMAMALGIHRRKDAQLFEEFKISESRLQKKVCDLFGLFVFINDSKLYLIHQTAKEYLLQKEPKIMTTVWRHSLNPSESETIMAKICVEYLSLIEIHDLVSPLETTDGLTAYLDGLINSETIRNHEIGALLIYSSEHWTAHFRKADFEEGNLIVSKARELCRVQSDQFRLWFPWMWENHGPEDLPVIMNDLTVAAFSGLETILEVILHAGSVNLEAKEVFYGRTALIWASYEGYEKVVEMLLTAGAHPNTQDKSEVDALQWASKNGHEKVVEILLDHHVNTNDNDETLSRSLNAALRTKHDEVAKLLLIKSTIVKENQTYNGALLWASELGLEMIAKILLEKGADVNAQGTPYGALQAASERGHVNIVRMLLDKGADVNAQTEWGNPLYAASAGGHPKIVKMLLAKGADVNARNEFAGTSLLAASQKCDEDIVQILLDVGADLNATGDPDDDEDFYTPLITAIEEDYENVVKILIDKDASVNDPEEYYDEALSWAIGLGNENVVNMLREKLERTRASMKDDVSNDPSVIEELQNRCTFTQNYR